MRAGIRFGRIGGASIVADASAFVLAILFGAVVLIDIRASGIDSSFDWLIAVIGGLGALVSVFLHELGHALVAQARGLRVRTIRLYLFGGYSVIDGQPSAATETLVAVAGPVGSTIVALVAWVLALVSGADTALGTMWEALALLNLAIALFNLIPGFPLDGGRLLQGILISSGATRDEAARRVAVIGQVVGYVAIGSGIVLLIRIGPIGLFVLAAGWFLISTAASTGRREQLTAHFDGMTVGDAMRPTPEAISGNAIVADVVDLYMVGPTLRSQPVELDGRVVGVLGQSEVDSVAPARWASARVRALMTPIGPADVVDASTPLDELLIRPAGPSRRVIVVDHDTVVGIIEGADLAQVLPERPDR